MDNLDLVIFTNSSYNYLWPIIDKNFDKIFENEINIYFYTDELTTKINKKFKQIEYDKTKNYVERLIFLFDNLKNKYILLIHDIDLIINFNFNDFKKYYNLLIQNDIDRLSLHIYNNTKTIIELDENIKICSLNDNFRTNVFIPFDYCPSIFNRIKFRNLLEFYKKESYSSLELNKNFQNDFKKNMKSYGIQLTNYIKIINCRGFTYSNLFTILHITTKGMLLDCECYQDLKDIFLQIYNDYNLKYLPKHPPININKFIF